MGLLFSTSLRLAVVTTALFSAGACTGQFSPGSEPVQWAADSSTVRTAAGTHYDRSAVWQLFWGKHYRELWATPVTAPVLRLGAATPNGPLLPLQAGGSYQSRTLRLQAPTGQQYVLRSVDKDASRALPEGWRRQLLGGLMKDQTSVIQPYGAYVAAALADAAGVYHANPRLVFLAADTTLGKFRKDYANALYLLEERPDGDQRLTPSFGRSPRVVSTAKMLADIHQRPGSYVNARAHLRARLLDIWLGDWSRREDQWRWASFPGPGTTEYRPIPRDRDQAFFLFNDGVLTRLVSWVVPRYQSFRGRIKLGDVEALTHTARALDRSILTSLSDEDFRQVADSLRLRLTDALIDQALQAGPPETRARVTAYFGPLLKARREQLPAVALRFRRELTREAWIVGTDRPERFVLSATGKAGQLRVQHLVRPAAGPDSLVGDYQLSVRHTRRLNVYGLGGDDVFELHGRLRPGFAVGLHGGNGKDEVQGKNLRETRGITWYTSSNPDPEAPAGVRVKLDPERALNYNASSWLGRYKLDD
ncbi:hypothetical protein [Hymenobacter saemangeumensis]|uniref:hypothetical protein n=1 Tax=Hymenobacter saemangeumensis TaxID=1084522 RepID=UPI0031EAFC88